MVLLYKSQKDSSEGTFFEDWAETVFGNNSGSMGKYEYEDSSMPIWVDFLKKNRHYYYPPINEPVVILKAAPSSAEKIGRGPITLVSRGCGTKFLEKEGALVRHLKDIVRVIYIDRAESALQQSLEEGRRLIPEAEHIIINHDMFDPDLRYEVIGKEVNALFGLTLANVKGFINDGPPKKDYQDKILAMQTQMSPGAHFLVTGDTNQDKRSNETAYAGQTRFALSMLERYGIDISADFEVEYHPDAYILAHYFVFNKKMINKVLTSKGTKTFYKGDKIHFNSSAKLPENVQIDWTEQMGFKSVFSPNQTIKDHQKKIAWYHFTKPDKQLRIVE